MEEQQNGLKVWVIPVVALVVGAGGGYYAGISYEKAAAEKRAEAAITESINPFGETANLFEETSVNPYENVKINPFE